MRRPSPLPCGRRTARAQRRPRIGIHNTTTANPDNPSARALIEGLREHGLVDGQTASLEFRWAAGRPDTLPALAAELAALPVDVFDTGNNFVTLAAKAAAPTIPIVMVLGVDPVRNGLIDSFARPGRYITGLTNEPGQQVHGKMLELLKEAVPRVEPIGVLVQEGIGYDHVTLAGSRGALEPAHRPSLLRVRSVLQPKAGGPGMIRGVVRDDPQASAVAAC